MEANIIEKIQINEQTPIKEYSTEEIDQYFDEQLEKYKIPKQHLQLITINQQRIPIVAHYTKEKTTLVKGTQGLIQILISAKDTRTLRTILKEHHDTILQEYNKTKHKPFIPRIDKEYLQLINKYMTKYQQQLQLQPVKTKHQYLITNKLGYTTNNDTIVFNKYLKYMSEETIKYVVYHELCHVYIHKHYGTLGHGKQFQELMAKEYTPEEEKQIIEN